MLSSTLGNIKPKFTLNKVNQLKPTLFNKLTLNKVNLLKLNNSQKLNLSTTTSTQELDTSKYLSSMSIHFIFIFILILILIIYFCYYYFLNIIYIKMRN